MLVALNNAVVSRAVVQAVLDDGFKPRKKHCHSACAGILGTLHPDLKKGAAVDDVIVGKSIEIVLQMAEYWLGQY